MVNLSKPSATDSQTIQTEGAHILIEQFNTNAAGTGRILEQVLGVLAQSPGTAGPTGADIVIIIGKDTANAIMQA